MSQQISQQSLQWSVCVSECVCVWVHVYVCVCVYECVYECVCVCESVCERESVCGRLRNTSTFHYWLWLLIWFMNPFYKFRSWLCVHQPRRVTVKFLHHRVSKNTEIFNPFMCNSFVITAFKQKKSDNSQLSFVCLHLQRVFYPTLFLALWEGNSLLLDVRII